MTTNCNPLMATGTYKPMILIIGNRMLNRCPQRYSCGTLFAYWTDGVAPAAVGVPANITAYQSISSTRNDGLCKWDNESNNIQLEVMRCSLIEHDVIYKYSGNKGYYDFCGVGFCGMM